MKTVSIGYIREDGDLQLFATLNNIDEQVPQTQFTELVLYTLAFFKEHVSPEVQAYSRNDAPDYVCLGEEV